MQSESVYHILDKNESKKAPQRHIQAYPPYLVCLLYTPNGRSPKVYMCKGHNICLDSSA